MSVRLVLYLPISMLDYDENLNKLNQTFEVLNKYDCNVLICDEPANEDWELIGRCEYYITNRSLENLRRMNIAYKFGVKCVAGSDLPIRF